MTGRKYNKQGGVLPQTNTGGTAMKNSLKYENQNGIEIELSDVTEIAGASTIWGLMQNEKDPRVKQVLNDVHGIVCEAIYAKGITLYRTKEDVEAKQKKVKWDRNPDLSNMEVDLLARVLVSGALQYIADKAYSIELKHGAIHLQAYYDCRIVQEGRQKKAVWETDSNGFLKGKYTVLVNETAKVEIEIVLT